jgi:hypothetical protein
MLSRRSVIRQSDGPLFINMHSRLIVFITFFATATLSATAAPSINATNKSGTWTDNRTIACGKVQVTVRTSCQEYEPDLPYCPSQIIRFVSPNSSKSSTYIYTMDNGTQDYIAQVQCFSYQGAHYVVASATNFGNCLGCEWDDVYTSAGEYLGSSESDVRTGKFKYKKLPEEIAKKQYAFQNEKHITADTDFIARTSHK